MMRPQDMTASRFAENAPFIRAAVATESAEVHPVLREWFGEEGVRRNLIAGIESRLTDAGDVREELRREGGVNGLHLLSIEHDRQVLASLRCQAGGGWEALIEARSCPITDHETIDAMRRSVRSHFAEARPERMRLYAPRRADESPSAALRTHPNAVENKRIVAALLGNLQEAPMPAEADRIIAREPSDLSFYPDYRRAYEEFWSHRPDLKHIVPIESEADMTHFRRVGVLRVLEVDGAFAGVMAATRQTAYGLRGWCMRERILAPAFRGRQLGAVSLWLFLRSLPTDGPEALFGTIAPGNGPSLRSAARLGRVDIGGTWWIDLREGAQLPSA